MSINDFSTWEYEDKINTFLDEIKEICDEYNLGLIGGCNSEQITGEIVIYDKDNPDKSGVLNIADMETKLQKDKYMESRGMDYYFVERV